MKKAQQEVYRERKSGNGAIVPEMVVPTGETSVQEIVAGAMERGESPVRNLVGALSRGMVEEWGEPEADPFVRVYRGLAPIAIDVLVQAMVGAEKWSDRLAAAKEVQDRAGLAGIKKIAAKVQIELSPGSIAALQAAARLVEKSPPSGDKG